MINEPRTHRFPWIVGLVLLVGTALGAGWFLNHTPAVGSDTSADKDKDVNLPVTVCIGQVDVDPGIVNLHPVVPGRVTEVVAEGIEVKKGDILLKLDAQLAESKLKEARADLDAAKGAFADAEKLPQQHRLRKKQQEDAVEGLRHQREAKAKEYKVKEKVFKENAISLDMLQAYEETAKSFASLVKVEEMKLEELKLFDSQAQTQIDRAKANVEAKLAHVDQAEFALRECSLAAPVDGTVLRVLTKPGEILGTNPMAPAIQFCPKGPKIIRAEVLQEWAYRVQAGQDVVIEDDTYAGATWQGRVKRVSDWFAKKRHQINEPFMLNDVQTLECLIEVTSEGRPLRIGQRVRVKIRQNPS
jgi:multidrug resistance efflux pump